jgi:hypothetical protein
VAIKLEFPAVVELTVKVATPTALVVPDPMVMVSIPPRFELNVTDFPETTFPFASLSVTVTVDVELPLAVTVLGEAITVD